MNCVYKGILFIFILRRNNNQQEDFAISNNRKIENEAQIFWTLHNAIIIL